MLAFHLNLLYAPQDRLYMPDHTLELALKLRGKTQ
mgnify:CR=1 FL=1